MVGPTLANVRARIPSPGEVPARLTNGLYHLVLPPSIVLASRFDLGTNVFDREWDLLVVLDTCRTDALRAVAGEYDFIDDVSAYWSVGGDTWEWLANTFDRRHVDTIRNTAYVTSNPNAKTVLEHRFERNHADRPIERAKVKRLKRWGSYATVPVEEFGRYTSLFERGVEQGHGAYPSPRSVTDHGILAARSGEFDRIVLHYMPPHYPYIARRRDGSDESRRPNGEPERPGGETTTGIELLAEPRAVTWDAYLDNLRWGLTEVELLLRNVDRERVAITADHGESFTSYLPPHYGGSINPRVRKVPWVETSATDSGTYEPDTAVGNADHSPEEILTALGYRG